MYAGLLQIWGPVGDSDAGNYVLENHDPALLPEPQKPGDLADAIWNICPQARRVRTSLRSVTPSRHPDVIAQGLPAANTARDVRGTDDKQMDDTDSFSTLMHTNLIGIFGQHDGTLRREAMRRTYAENIAFTDPDGTVHGYDAVDELIRRVLDKAPATFIFAPDGPVRPARCSRGAAVDVRANLVGHLSSAVSTLPPLPTNASHPCRPCSQAECQTATTRVLEYTVFGSTSRF